MQLRAEIDAVLELPGKKSNASIDHQATDYLTRISMQENKS